MNETRKNGIEWKSSFTVLGFVPGYNPVKLRNHMISHRNDLLNTWKKVWFSFAGLAAHAALFWLGHRLGACSRAPRLSCKHLKRQGTRTTFHTGRPPLFRCSMLCTYVACELCSLVCVEACAPGLGPRGVCRLSAYASPSATAQHCVCVCEPRDTSD